VTNAPKYFSLFTLVECCDHIQATCYYLIPANLELKKTLTTTRSALLNLAMEYENAIEQKITNASALKDSIFNVANEAYTLLQQVHD